MNSNPGIGKFTPKTAQTGRKIGVGKFTPRKTKSVRVNVKNLAKNIGYKKLS